MIAAGAAQERALRARIDAALRMVTVPLPHLAGLAAAVRPALDARVPTMGVFASGRLVANPGFVARLKDNELVFVLAHELLHLALRTHDRARGSGRLEFNYAHDYIINDMLRAELGFAAIPAGGLDMPGARERSAEDIVLEMRRNADLMRTRSDVFEGADMAMRGLLGEAADTANGDDRERGDVLADARERAMFPDDAHEQDRRKAEIESVAARGRDLAAARRAMQGRGLRSGEASATVTALRQGLQPPWQRALQKWLESSAPGQRTFARPSRRGADTLDVVRPGRQRCSWMLTVLLDTSGSMADLFPLVLGAIADFCDAAAVDRVRLLQCDVALASDEILAPEELAQCTVSGLGGSDLSPALWLLAQDPQVTAAVVVTDGEVTIPSQPMPYGILWILPPDRAASFQPSYGQVLTLEGLRP